ncbi:sodium-dependent bicarbonate transport family permease [Paludisphaera mucosa]
MLHEFWHNFRHNLFKPLLLFFYLGFLVPILRVQFEFPYVMYQALTIYLLIAIGWHGGEELAHLNPGSIKTIIGFMGVGFLANTIMGILAFIILRATTRMRRVDQATVAGYYGSDSAGTFVTALGVLGTAHVAFDAYMPVMLAIMEIPGCLVALFLVARYRAQGMDALGNMPFEAGYDPDAKPLVSTVDEHGHGNGHATAVQDEAEMSLEKMERVHLNGGNGKKKGFLDAKLMHEVFLNTGLYLLFGGITIGFISGLQGPEVTRADDSFFVTLFQGVLCLFLLEMGMTASRKLKDLKTAGWNYVAFGLLAPNLFATLGIIIIHTFAWMTGTHFQLGTYVLFSVLCGSASYIAVPAVQRLAIPEASPTLPLAASLGLTFSYNVTIGIPIYMEIAKAITRDFPIA